MPQEEEEEEEGKALSIQLKGNSKRFLVQMVLLDSTRQRLVHSRKHGTLRCSLLLQQVTLRYPKTTCQVQHKYSQPVKCIASRQMIRLFDSNPKHRTKKSSSNQQHVNDQKSSSRSCNASFMCRFLTNADCRECLVWLREMGVEIVNFYDAALTHEPPTQEQRLDASAVFDRQQAETRARLARQTTQWMQQQYGTAGHSKENALQEIVQQYIDSNKFEKDIAQIRDLLL